MKNYFDEIKTKLIREIEIEDIEIVNNSHKHKGHKFILIDAFMNSDRNELKKVFNYGYL